jgi:hypothetical protein
MAPLRNAYDEYWRAASRNQSLRQPAARRLFPCVPLSHPYSFYNLPLEALGYIF